MRKAAAIVALVCGVVSAHISEPASEFLLREQFKEWKTQYGKSYDSQEEENSRYRNFISSVERVARRRSTAENPSVFGLTKFADMSVEEFKGAMLTSRKSEKIEAEVAEPKFTSTPSSYDWRNYGVVTPVKNQGYCGSCWAHSAVETIESAWAIAGNTLTEFSVEQVTQCDTVDDGCDGGWPYKAYQYVERAGGLATEASYPYTTATYYGTTGTCQSFTVAGGQVSGYKYATTQCSSVTCNSQNEATMAANLASYQPLSVVCYAETWQDYTSGILTESDCKSGAYTLDHAIQAVGYESITGSDGYWIIRNSWGADWGVDGYIYLAYGTNTCGVADDATIVTIA